MCDAAVQGDVLENEKYFDNVMKFVGERKGYGGTDFRPVFTWINDNKPQTKLLIFFTDLYGKDDVLKLLMQLML